MPWVALHIFVEQAHINAGDWDIKHPLALAIRAAAEKAPPFQGHGLGAVQICFIGGRQFGVSVEVGTSEHWHLYRCDDMPNSAYEFIERYDTEHKELVKPFSFTLNLHGSPLRDPLCPGCKAAALGGSGAVNK